jgi:hypothetical protein
VSTDLNRTHNEDLVTLLNSEVFQRILTAAAFSRNPEKFSKVLESLQTIYNEDLIARMEADGTVSFSRREIEEIANLEEANDDHSSGLDKIRAAVYSVLSGVANTFWNFVAFLTNAIPNVLRSWFG